MTFEPKPARARILLCVCGSLVLLTGCRSGALSVKELRCEHLTAPIGVDAPQPRLGWSIESSESNTFQTSYLLSVDTDSLRVVHGQAGWTASGSGEQLARYAGPRLQPFTRYYWSVRVEDNHGNKATSAVTSFETGMVDPANWQGEWISDGKSIHDRPAPYFRREVNLDKEIASARAYITSAGLYELSVNGHRVGDLHLDPTYTKFDKRTLYSTYDITPLLKQGANAFGVILGNGWYNHQSTAVWDFHTAYWRGRPAMLLNVRITYADGTTDTFASDGNWRTTDNGPVIFNSIYTAEHYDARLEMPGWDRPGYDDSGWQAAVTLPSPTEQIVSQQLTPVRITEVLRPVSVDKKSDTCYVFAFAKNIAGKTELNVQGEAGTELRLIHAERLYDNGHVDLSNIDLHYRPTDDSDPFQTDIVILSGRKDTFSPKFNYKGFQYVEVHSSKPIALTAENLTALEMHSDVPLIGGISSSNPTIDKMWAASCNSYLSNLFGYPTDCPQREKNGWTGDSHIASETGLYNYDAITVYEKWLADYLDEQKPDGTLPSIIPTAGWGYDWGNGPDWTSSVAIIPWDIYRFYGDATLLERMYPAIRKYVDRITNVSEGHLTDWGLGDWVPVTVGSDKRLTSSIYYHVDALILSKAAALLGHTEDARTYSELAGNIRNAINERYLDRETGSYASGTQTELSMPLYWGIVPDDMRTKVAATLYKKVEADNFFLNVGLLGTKSILNALSENGYADAAYRIAAQETYPSWGWWIANGATSFYENWNIDAQYDISLNHIMFGEVNAWLYKGLGGIFPDEQKPGFRHTVLRPNFVDGLEQFTARHGSPYGEVVSSWSKQGGKVVYTAQIPAGSTATLYLPQASKYKVSQSVSEETEGDMRLISFGSGTYRFEIE